MMRLVLAGVLVAAGCARGPARDVKKNGEPGKVEAVEAEPAALIVVTSPAFGAGGPIPKRHTGEGEDVSPPLSWKGVPEGARELALVCDDPDAPREEPWVHWVLYGLAPDCGGIEEGSAGGGVEGKNSWQKAGWGGPMPPKGHGVHHYHFRVYALDAKLDLEAGATKAELLAAIRGHIIAQGDFVGTYERKR